MMRKYLAIVKKWFNPNYVLSPLLIKTFSLEKSGLKYVTYLKSERYAIGEIKNYDVVPHMRCVTSGDMASPEGRMYQLENARYITNYPDKTLLLDSDNRFITESSSTMTSPSSFNWTHLRRSDHESLDVAMPFRAVSNNFYHTLIDNASRLYSLYGDEMLEHKHIDVLCVEKLSAVEQYLFERLLPDNTSVRVLEAGAAYTIKKCLFPTFVTRQYSGYVPDEILTFFEKKLMPDRPRKANRLIYISRKKAAVRRVLNEDDVISSLEVYGFQAYCLEDMSFEEQIELFYDAHMVVGPHGAGFTNLIFSKNVGVLELFPYKYVKPSYYYLTRSINGIYDYTCVEDGSIGGDFSVDIELLRSKVATLFNNNPKQTT